MTDRRQFSFILTLTPIMRMMLQMDAIKIISRSWLTFLLGNECVVKVIIERNKCSVAGRILGSLSKSTASLLLKCA